MYLRFAISCMLLMSSVWPAFSQQLADTLQEVNINGATIKGNYTDIRLQTFSPGQKILTIDSITRAHYQQQSLATLLTQQVPVFVKSYGFNGLATLNFRGSSAAQSAVYWNGVPIANAALGIADVSVLPVSIFDEIKVVYGSASSLWGSGNVGGAVILGSGAPVFDSARRVRAVLSAAKGSFGQYLYSGTGSYSSSRWSISVKALGQQAKNDFRYRDPLGRTGFNIHADLSAIAALGNIAYKLSEKNILRLSYWQQAYDRDIPPATFEAASAKSRLDASLRTVFEWRHNSKMQWYARISYFKDRLQYEDSSIPQATDQSVHQYFTEVGWRAINHRRHGLLFFAPLQRATIKTISGNQKIQSRYALAAAYSYQDISRRLHASVSARAERIDNAVIFLPGISSSFHMARWLELKANIQKTYRAPSLNERFYEPGGNPALKPEKGWGIDGGYVLNHITSRGWKLFHEVSVYNRTINNWIIWFGGAIWTPHNIATVRSRGIELQQSIHIPAGQAVYYARLSWSYTQAITRSSYLPGDGSIGMQIPYTPRYGGSANVGFSSSRLNLNINYTYTGYRYFNADESGYLPPFSTLNASAQYQLRNRSSFGISLFAQAYNMLNERYMIVNGRPMPGTNFMTGASAIFK